MCKTVLIFALILFPQYKRNSSQIISTRITKHIRDIIISSYFKCFRKKFVLLILYLCDHWIVITFVFNVPKLFFSHLIWVSGPIHIMSYYYLLTSIKPPCLSCRSKVTSFTAAVSNVMRFSLFIFYLFVLTFIYVYVCGFFYHFCRIVWWFVFALGMMWLWGKHEMG